MARFAVPRSGPASAAKASCQTTRTSERGLGGEEVVVRAGRLEHRLTRMPGLWGEVFRTSYLAEQCGAACRVKRV